MPEEKKKGGFTFSDKIKNSKQASSKSFANRVPSKIGNDGKPRQTLFARTKRDVPFFAAAAAALLLLPFMYKYSGNVDEEPAAITPGYEDAIVNPDRSGFDFSGDPDGQISQLSGRDSMDLIVGLGKKQAEEEDADSLADLYRSGYDASSAKSSYASSDMEEEQNTTNIYKYRKQAAPQTRAAFRRAPTKVNNLKTAGLSGRGGGRPVGVWGGSMKKAANKVRSNGPINSPKPVSLQPLQATGRPARSYFGQGAAQEAKRSKDAMSKANAGQALADAQVRAVEPGRIGGIAGGTAGGPGGGSGKLDRNFNFQGKEPWWWDMMKTRAQMRWERWFNFGFSWLDWGAKLIQGWMAGLLNCLVMGDEDGEPGSFLGQGAGSGKVECCGMDQSKWEANSDLAKIPFDEKHCKANLGTVAKAQMKDKCESKWVDKSGASVRLSGWQARRKCLGASFSGTALALDETSGCKNMANKRYEVVPQGDARKWHTYIYVIARNDVPQTLIDLNVTSPTGNRYDLCTDQDGRRIGSKRVASVGATGFPTNTPDPNDVTRYTDQGTGHHKEAKKVRSATNIQTVDQANQPKVSKADKKAAEKAAKESKAAQAELKAAQKDLEAKKAQMEAAQHKMEEQSKSAREVEKAKGFDAPETAAAKESSKKAYEEYSQAAKAYESAKSAVSVAEGKAKKAQEAAAAKAIPGDIASLKTNISYKDTEHNITPPLYERDKSDILNSCVIYVQEGANFNWKNFKAAEIEAIEKWIREAGVDEDDEEITRLAQKAFMEFDFQQVRSVSMKQELAFRMDSKGMDALPMILDRFQYAYIKHRGTAASSESRSGRQNVDKRKWRDEDKYIEGDPCPFDSEWSFDCTNDAEGKQAPTATVVWKKGYNNNVDGSDIKAENVKASFVTANTPIALQVLPGSTEGGHFSKTYTFRATFDGKMPKGKQAGIITWTLNLGDKNMMAECEYGAGETTTGSGVQEKPKNEIVTTTDNPKKKDDGPRQKGEPMEKLVLDESNQEHMNNDDPYVFAPTMAQVPKNITDREGGSKMRPSAPYLQPTPNDPNNPNGQSCYEAGNWMNSRKASAFVNQVKNAYNEKNPDKPISFSGVGLSDSVFIDALHVADELGITDVPKAAVCELARDFVRASKDKHAGTFNQNMKSLGNKAEDDEYVIYHNELGAFLAYVHDDAMLYPTTHLEIRPLGQSPQEVCDWRFQPNNVEDGKCQKGLGPKMGKAYHHNNYNNNSKATIFNTFSGSLTSTMKKHPLKALVEGKTPISPKNCGQCAGQALGKKIQKYHKEYKGLWLDEDEDNTATNHCETFVGEGTMKVKDALEYVSGVCAAGLDYKPHGISTKEYRAGQGSTGGGGGNTSGSKVNG